MAPRQGRLTAREVERLLASHGFELVSQSGSHRKWRNEERRIQVIVPEHRGKVLPIGTMRAILKAAEIAESD